MYIYIYMYTYNLPHMPMYPYMTLNPNPSHTKQFRGTHCKSLHFAEGPQWWRAPLEEPRLKKVDLRLRVSSANSFKVSSLGSGFSGFRSGISAQNIRVYWAFRV